MKTNSKLLLITLPIILIGTLSLLYFGALAPDMLLGWFSVPLVNNTFVDAKFKYQIVTFGVALVVLAVI